MSNHANDGFAQASTPGADRLDPNLREPFSDGDDLLDGERRSDVLLPNDTGAPTGRHDRVDGTKDELLDGQALAATEDEAVIGPDGTIVLRGERLRIATETHEWARVKVTRRVVTEERTITVPVRREELVVEYLDDAKPSEVPGVVRGSTESVSSDVVEEFTLLEEIPEVEMVIRPREKVRLVVDTVQSTVEHTDTVAREEVLVEQDGVERRVDERN